MQWLFVRLLFDVALVIFSKIQLFLIEIPFIDEGMPVCGADLHSVQLDFLWGNLAMNGFLTVDRFQMTAVYKGKYKNSNSNDSASAVKGYF